MSLISLLRVGIGAVSVQPGDVRMLSTDSIGTITTAGYLQNTVNAPANIIGLAPSDVIECLYSYNVSSGSGTLAILTVSISAGVITLSSNESVAVSTASATPGTIRALVGKISDTATVMTSGNIVGVRGEADLVGASGGFIYGAQGKVIATGTLSGSSWTAGVFGQLDVHAATINAGQVAAIWGDWGTTGATATSMTGARGIVFTNTTANILNAQAYLYGPATNLLELDDNSGAYGASYFVASGTGSGSWGNGTPPTPSKVLRITMNGTAYYLPLVAQNS